MFQTRNGARLHKLCADERFAVIFAVDYLVGVHNADGLVSNAQLVMLSWGAWSPFSSGAFTIADTVHVPLVGGPRPNPDGVLCFKNMLSLRDGPDDALARIDPQIHLKFNFAIVDSTDKNLLMQIPSRPSRIEEPTPQPKPDITAHFEPEPERDERPPVVEEAGAAVESDASDLVPSRKPQQQQQRPLQKSTSVPALSPERSLSEAIGVVESAPTRVAAFSRSLTAFFAHVHFPPILNRAGKSPPSVDPTANRPINWELEVNTRLDTHEIVLQFLGITTLRNTYISKAERGSRFFFTFRFYRFDQVTTEMLLAHSTPDAKRGDPAVFQRVDDGGRPLQPAANGFMARFTVERCATHANDTADFADYLLHGHLTVDVWNADSLMHVGSAEVPLKAVLRQGADSVQASLQCPIVEAGFTNEPTTTGILFLRLANIGHPSSNQLELFESRNKAAVVSNRLVRLGRSSQIHQLRAKPLSAIHESALQRFLNTQKLDIRQRKEEVFGRESLRRVRQWDELKQRTSENVPKATLKRFIFEEELEAYRTLRNEGKTAKLLKAVFSSITANHTLYAKSGQTEFFEYALRNTFAEPVNCVIDINDPRLTVITNADEWKFFKEANRLKTTVERDLFAVEPNGGLSVYLNALESLHVPFKYDPFGRGPPFDVHSEPFVIKAIFKRADTGEPLAILELFVQSRGHTWERSFRWFHEENARCSKLLRLQGIKGNQKIAAIRCSDPHVLCSVRNAANGNQELLITCYALDAPNMREFVVLMYADRFFSQLLACWGFSLHATQRLNVEGVQAQTTKIPLFLKPPNIPDAVIEFKTSSDCATVVPSGPLALENPHVLNDVKLVIVPNFSGRRSILITAVERNARRLLNSWTVVCDVREPNVVKTYEIRLPAMRETITKRIRIANEYPIERTFRVATSNERIVSVENELETIAAHSDAEIRFLFHPVEVAETTVVEVLVFVEDAANGQQEEAYALEITYAR
ncbi:Nephrocystin-4 [Aphelenchoides fujianensis]|nr:Nephrocystin-4 [Aphelenchoides fujianensis]